MAVNAAAVVAAEMPPAAWVPTVVISVLGLLGAVYVIAHSTAWRRQALLASAAAHQEMAFSHAAELEVRAHETARYLNERWTGRVYRRNELTNIPGFDPAYPYNYALYQLLSSDDAPHHQQLATSAARLQAYWEGVLQLADKELLPLPLLQDPALPWAARGEAYRVLSEPLAMASFARRAAAVAQPANYLDGANRPPHFALLQLHHRQRAPAGAAAELDAPAMQQLLEGLQAANEWRRQGWRATVE